jgi:hypothetical protein
MIPIDQLTQIFTRLGQLFFEPLQLHFQATDLLVQLGLVRLLLAAPPRRRFRGEKRLEAIDRTPLPLTD